MTTRRLDELGDLQRQVMDVLWKHDEATVHEVRDRLIEPGREPAYTTILSVLQKLEKAGWVTHRREGRTHIFRPKRSLDDAGRNSVRGLVERVFGGDRMTMLQHLIRDENLSAEDLQSLRQLIDERSRAEQSRSGGGR